MAQSPLYGSQARRSEYRDRLAAQLIGQGSDSSPVQHWSQGAARLAQALAGGLIGMKQDQRADERQKAYTTTMQGAMSATDPEAMITALSGNQDTAQQALALRQQSLSQKAQIEAEQRRADQVRAQKEWEFQNDPSKQLPELRLYEAAKAQGFTGSIMDFQREQAKVRQDGGRETFGLTPVYGTDAKGNPVMLQTGSLGTIRQAPLPEGVSAAPGGTQRIDLGTHYAILDRNGAMIGQMPKDLAGAEAAKVRGKTVAENEGAAPEAIVKADSILQNIDGVLSHPGIKLGTGVTSALNVVPGTNQFAFGERVKQLQGQAFLQAFESLKGGGQITQVEGDKATAAIARLNTGQSEKDFRQALGELRDIVTRARERAAARLPQAQGAATVPQAAPQQAAPAQAQPAAPQNIDSLLNKYAP